MTPKDDPVWIPGACASCGKTPDITTHSLGCMTTAGNSPIRVLFDIVNKLKLRVDEIDEKVEARGPSASSVAVEGYAFARASTRISNILEDLKELGHAELNKAARSGALDVLNDAVTSLGFELSAAYDRVRHGKDL